MTYTFTHNGSTYRYDESFWTGKKRLFVGEKELLLSNGVWVSKDVTIAPKKSWYRFWYVPELIIDGKVVPVVVIPKWQFPFVFFPALYFFFGGAVPVLISFFCVYLNATIASSKQPVWAKLLLNILVSIVGLSAILLVGGLVQGAVSSSKSPQSANVAPIASSEQASPSGSAEKKDDAVVPVVAESNSTSGFSAPTKTTGGTTSTFSGSIQTLYQDAWTGTCMMNNGDTIFVNSTAKQLRYTPKVESKATPSILISGDMLYLWVESEKQGAMMSLSALSSPSMLTNPNNPFGSKIDATCTPGTVSATLFQKPSGITFIDPQVQLQKAQAAQKQLEQRKKEIDAQMGQ